MTFFLYTTIIKGGRGLLIVLIASKIVKDCWFSRLRAQNFVTSKGTRIYCPFIHLAQKLALLKLIIFLLLILYSFNVSLYFLNYLQTSFLSYAVNCTTANSFDLILCSLFSFYYFVNYCGLRALISGFWARCKLQMEL